MVNDRQSLDLTTFARPQGGGEVEWRISAGPVPYPEAVTEMESRAADIAERKATELVWLLEHPPLYTSGTSGKAGDLLDPRFPLFATGRGGQLTYHGPGQRVAYVMLDLDRRGRDLRNYVHALEGWAIAALAALGVDARRAEGRIGIWADAGGREAKIGAIGVRVRRWVTMHGLAINVAPKLSHFSGIVPCGIRDFPVTSLDELGATASLPRLDQALRRGVGRFLTALDGRGGEA